MEVEKLPIQLDFAKFPERVAIIGSRSFSDNRGVNLAMAELVRRFISKLPKHVEIVSGGAVGVDTYAADAAKKHKRKLKVEWPDRQIPVPQRFFVRNKLIVDYVKEKNGIVVAFVQHGKMQGSSHTLHYAADQGVPRIIFHFERQPLRIVRVEVIDCSELVISDELK